MSWTYTQNPANSAKDAVRFLVGQTSTSDPVRVQDAEIDWAITQTGNSYAAAVLVGESMLQQYAGHDALSLTVGNLSETYGDRSARLSATLAHLKRQMALRNVRPDAGGITVTSRVAHEADISLTPHVFAVGMDDNPAAFDLTPSTSA